MFALTSPLVLGLSTAALQSQTSPPSGSETAPAHAGTSQSGAAQPQAMNRNVVVLDAAHGGPDVGANLGDQTLEKDVTLALAARLKGALVAAGITVISTRDADSLNALTTDQRAEIANRARAFACVVLHATRSGSGLHVYASELAPKDPPATPDATLERPAFEPIPWETAQADWVRRSLQLQGEVQTAMGAARIPVLAGRSPVRPLDNMMCPAVAIEVAPLRTGSGDATPVSDAEYQKRVVDTLAHAIQTWKTHADLAAAASAGDWMKDLPGAQTQAAVQVAARVAAKAAAAADAAGREASRKAARAGAGAADAPGGENQ